MGGSTFTVQPDPPLPVHGCQFWDNGDVAVRIKRKSEDYQHLHASYINPGITFEVIYSFYQSYGQESKAQDSSQDGLGGSYLICL